MISACDNHPWNDPYPLNQATANIRYTSFQSSPKTLDPARSYSLDETIFTAQIYEPPLQYHYLKRPYTLVPLTASQMPSVSTHSSYVAYDISITPGIYYQPHPAFAKNNQGKLLYLHLSSNHLKHYHQFRDFTHLGTRELVAEDYVYEIKRLADPSINSPIYGLMAEKIVGLAEFSHQLQLISPGNQWLDLRKYSLAGAIVLDRYHFRILLRSYYPQFIYWLAMPFFSPIPWEADAFYSRPEIKKNNITLDWYPVGTGAYVLSENNPNRRMVLTKNPLFHAEFYPQSGEPGDKAAGYLQAAGMRLPFIDKVIFTLEKESIPRWNKFLQGYYDQSTIASDSFDQAIQITNQGKPVLTPELKSKNIRLQVSATQALYYMGFNMLDPVIGGNSLRTSKLRQAISIAIDFEEYKNIFLNGRGIVAQGPLPPGVFGFKAGKAGMNRYVYDWKHSHLIRKPLAYAKQLMQEAGYPGGIDPATGQPLILNYDYPVTSGPDEKSLLEWMRGQFAKIGIQLNIRSTDYNRFQEKMRLGEGQIFSWGWIADYPDPENFLFLLYGPNSKTKNGGENAANYQNSRFDYLFDQMKNLPNNEKRQAIIDEMLEITRHDVPWIFGIDQEDFTLNQSWIYPSKPNILAYNSLKYQRINPILREKLRNRWNQPILWPLWLILLILILISLPVIIRYRQKERKSVKL